MKPKNPKETSLTEIENFAAAELNSFIRTILRGGKTRRMNGELYAKRSMNNPSLCHGLQKHFSRVKKKIDIVNDTQFKEANEMFHAMLVKLKQAG